MINNLSSSSEYFVKIFLSSTLALKLIFLYLSIMSSIVVSAFWFSSKRPGGKAFLTKREIECASMDASVLSTSSWSCGCPKSLSSVHVSTIRRIDSSWPSRSEPNMGTKPAPRSVAFLLDVFWTSTPSSLRTSMSSLPLPSSLSSSKSSSSIGSLSDPSSPESVSQLLWLFEEKSLSMELSESLSSESLSSESLSSSAHISMLKGGWCVSVPLRHAILNRPPLDSKISPTHDTSCT